MPIESGPQTGGRVGARPPGHPQTAPSPRGDSSLPTCRGPTAMGNEGQWELGQRGQGD